MVNFFVIYMVHFFMVHMVHLFMVYMVHLFQGTYHFGSDDLRRVPSQRRGRDATWPDLALCDGGLRGGRAPESMICMVHLSHVFDLFL